MSVLFISLVVCLSLILAGLFKPSILVQLEKSKFMLKAIIIIVLLIGILILTGMAPNPRINDNFIWIEKPYPEIGSIIGSIKNISDKEFQTVTVKFILVDDDGNKLDDANCVINNFKPGVTWTFSAPVYETKAAGFKFMGIEVN